MRYNTLKFPDVSPAVKLEPDKNRLFIGSYGFEPRSLGWVNHQEELFGILNSSVVFRYKHPKGRNRIKQLQRALNELGSNSIENITYNVHSPHNLENIIDKKFQNLFYNIDEIIIDITSMTKLLILVCLCKLSIFPGTVRIVYSEAKDYAPTKIEYEKSKEEMGLMANFPSRGFESIIRMKCLGSIRMQGQPVSLVAFTSFNEQLIRHMLGTMNPHRLLFINGMPSREDYQWREWATQEIHKNLINQNSSDNPIDKDGLLTRVASALDYRETIYKLDEIYNQFGIHERIICAATGSKMQTVGLFFSKIEHPDIHIEYPTPDSYFVRGMSEGIKEVHEIIIPCFSKFLKNLQQ
jgi:hypothetical protein